ncbi:NUDIX domain-containing protein [Micromonospora sp. LOL_021]|uniref:NUDIX domain-containing protein n=1 Tax=Micromonospora sp. LOL_021 TaxID=3345417 RepID=UPI003A8A1F41
MSSLPDDYTATLPRKRMGSAVLLRDRDGRILLVEPTYKDYWELPGGVVEADESPYDAAVRELAEELGLAVTPGRLLVVDCRRRSSGCRRCWLGGPPPRWKRRRTTGLHTLRVAIRWGDRRARAEPDR